jgi:hypothetical protein
LIYRDDSQNEPKQKDDNRDGNADGFDGSADANKDTSFDVKVLVAFQRSGGWSFVRSVRRNDRGAAACSIATS